MVKLTAEPRVVVKNTDGHLGPICNNCGGFGYLLGFKNTDSGCRDCAQTGVAMPTTGNLEARIANLETELQGLKNIIIKELRKIK